MSGRTVMSSYEGAALRVQLDGMLKVLQPLAQEAGERGDQPVIDLLAALQAAYSSAVTIEARNTTAPRKGVSFVRK